MKTLKELDIFLQNQEGGNSSYFIGYRDAIQGIFKDIQESEAISVASIEKYLEKLLNK